MSQITADAVGLPVLPNPTVGVLNKPLLLQTLGFIQAYPDAWNQGDWHCGTRACFAGWATVFAGGTLPDGENSRCLRPDGGTDTVNAFAAEALGLSPDEASTLFSGGNTMEDLTNAVRDILGLNPQPVFRYQFVVTRNFTEDEASDFEGRLDSWLYNDDEQNEPSHEQHGSAASRVDKGEQVADAVRITRY